MQRYPSNLSEEDLRTYRRWTRGVYLSYLAAVIIAFALTFLKGSSTSEFTASNDTPLAGQKIPSASIDLSKSTIATAKP